MFLRLARFGDTGRLATSSAQDLFNVPTPFGSGARSIPSASARAHGSNLVTTGGGASRDEGATLQNRAGSGLQNRAISHVKHFVSEDYMSY